MNCESLLADNQSFREIAENADFDQIHIKMLNFEHNSQSFVVNVKSSLTSTKRTENGEVDRSFQDRQMRFNLDQVQNLFISMAERYPDTAIQSSRHFEKLVMIA